MFTFFILKCIQPAIPLLKISDTCTAVLADAGGIPMDNEKVVEVTPYDIPIAPSIIAKIKPAIRK
jgi:hypothetical protein